MFFGKLVTIITIIITTNVAQSVFFGGICERDVLSSRRAVGVLVRLVGGKATVSPSREGLAGGRGVAVHDHDRPSTWAPVIVVAYVCMYATATITAAADVTEQHNTLLSAAIGGGNARSVHARAAAGISSNQCDVAASLSVTRRRRRRRRTKSATVESWPFFKCIYNL